VRCSGSGADTYSYLPTRSDSLLLSSMLGCDKDYGSGPMAISIQGAYDLILYILKFQTRGSKFRCASFIVFISSDISLFVACCLAFVPSSIVLFHADFRCLVRGRALWATSQPIYPIGVVATRDGKITVICNIFNYRVFGSECDCLRYFSHEFTLQALGWDIILHIPDDYKMLRQSRINISLIVYFISRWVVIPLWHHL
jgi:hypothetical protein